MAKNIYWPHILNAGSDQIKNLVACYSFDDGNSLTVRENFRAKNGTITGNGISWDTCFGNRKKCINFTKQTGAYVECQTSSELLSLTGTAERSISCWFKFRSKSNWQVIASLDDAAGFSDLRIQLNNSADQYVGIFITTPPYSSYYYVLSSSPVVINRWYHLVACTDGSDFFLYINGVKNSDYYDAPVFPNKTLTNFKIGNYKIGDVPMDGWVRDVRVYKKILTASQAYNIYSKGDELYTPKSSIFLSQVAPKVFLPPTYPLDSVRKRTSTSLTRVIDLQNPIANHPLNKGLGEWWLGLPNLTGGSKVYGLKRRYNGNINGSVWRAGPNGLLYLDFDGINDYVDFGDISELEGFSSIMVTAWIKPTFNPVSTYGMILSKDATYQRSWTWFYGNGFSSSEMVFEFFSSNTDTYASRKTRTGLNDGNWHFVTCRWINGENVKHSLDGNGEEDQTTFSSGGAFSGIIQSTTANVNIGRREFGGAEAYWSGGIRDVRIYTNVPRYDITKELYKEGLRNNLNLLNTIKYRRPIIYYPQDPASSSPTKYGIYRYEKRFDYRKPEISEKLNRGNSLTRGLIGCWLFNEGGGTTVRDYVGKFNGTTNNSPTREVFANGKVLKTVAGSSQYVSTSLTGYELENGYTVIAGIIPTSFPAPQSTILGNNDSSNSWAQIQMSLDSDGSIKYVISNDNATDYKIWDSSDVSLTLTAGKHHIVAFTNNGTLDDSGNRLYVDGRDLGLTGAETGIPSYPLGGFSGDLAIGRNGATSSSYASVSYNFVYIYNRPLTSGEIAQITKNPYSIFEARSWRYVYQVGGNTHYISLSPQLLINSLTGSKFIGAAQTSESIVINSQSSILKLLYASIPIVSPNGCVITLSPTGKGLLSGLCGTTLQINSNNTANSILAGSLIEQLVINSSESVNIIASGSSNPQVQINNSDSGQMIGVGQTSNTLQINSTPNANAKLVGQSSESLQINNSISGGLIAGAQTSHSIVINNSNSCNIKVIGQNTLTLEIDSTITAQTSAGATIDVSTVTELEINTIIDGIKRLYGDSSCTAQIIDTLVATKQLFGALTSSLEIDSGNSANSKLGANTNPSLVISSSLGSNIRAGAESNIINSISSILSANSRVIGQSQNQLMINDSIIVNKLIRGESVTSLQLGSLIMSKLLLSAQINPTVQININSGSRCIYSGNIQDVIRISSNLNASYKTLGTLSVPLRINVSANGSVLNIRYSIELPLNVNIANVLRHELNINDEVELEAHIARTILNSIFEI